MKKNYLSRDLKNLISKLPEGDKNLLIESLFNGMIKAMGAFYSTSSLTDSEIDSLISVEINAVKGLIEDRLMTIKKSEENNKSISLEGDPSIPTDKTFAFDAKIDFQRLMESISKSI